MNKNYIFAGVGVIGIIVVIIVLVMMNTHPSLTEIVENKDCQELGKYDQRMDETYGFDIKKGKAEENISDELWSKAISLGIDCSFDAVKSVYGNDLSDEDNTKSSYDVIYEAAEIIKERDCKQFVEWYNANYQYIQYLDFMSKPDLDSYKKYCKDPYTVLDGNGIDIEEKWGYYSTWDKK